MPPNQPQPIEVLSRRRIGAALAALTNPELTPSDASVQLDEDERQSIARAVGQASHPLGGFAQTLLDQWDQLDVDDRVAGLLLFAEIVNRHHREQTFGRRIAR